MIKQTKQTKKDKGAVTLTELAKDLKLTAKELIAQLSESGMGISSSKNELDDNTVKKIKKAMAKKGVFAVEDTAKKGTKPKKALPVKKAAVVKLSKAKKAKQPEPVPEKTKEKAPEKIPEKIADKPVAAATPVSPVIAQKETPKPQPQHPPLKVLKVKFPITVKDLASKMSMGPSLLIKSLLDIRILATMNQLVDEGVAGQLGEKFGYKIENLPTIEEETVAVYEKQDASKMMFRAPVVTFMGHVDHGKTSLMDYIRKSKIADFEKGGITQHIGAYRVHFSGGDITFLDTPGHEAFTAMRARGATATDIVVLVIAADEGIKPQTIEALDHAKAAKVPIVVALNKIDKPNIDMDRVKKQLSELDLLPEDWGGKTITVGVSAKTGQGIDKLLEMIVLESEMLELKADPTKPAKGVVVESKLSKGGGPVATVLVEEGTLRPGDIIVCGQYCGKIRALINDRIHKIKEATPSMPVEILGLSGVPQAGDQFFVVSDERKAREIVDVRQRKAKEEKGYSSMRRISLEDLYSEIQKGSVKELNVVLKTDVQGSLGALRDSLLKIDTKEIKLNVIHGAVGEVNGSDVLLAAASNAIIIGLHTSTTPEADETIKEEGIDVKLYSIIYEAISDVRAALEGMLEPKLKEVFMGRAVVRQVFQVSKAGTIAGCYVQKGAMKRTNNCRLLRNGQEVYKGKFSSLKRFKDDVKDVAEGFECGIALEGFKNIEPGDIIEAFEVQKIARKL
ncbi:MAG: translation initiation factor IF-2 [Candidatus Omnitrophica bacterium]|nr:translation initiation factor IF-2 [Candidatus Omnitrophota bacterium]